MYTDLSFHVIFKSHYSFLFFASWLTLYLKKINWILKLIISYCFVFIFEGTFPWVSSLTLCLRVRNQRQEWINSKPECVPVVWRFLTSKSIVLSRRWHKWMNFIISSFVMFVKPLQSDSVTPLAFSKI